MIYLDSNLLLSVALAVVNFCYTEVAVAMLSKALKTFFRSKSCVEVLIENSAFVNAADKFGITPLHVAALKVKHFNMKMTKSIIFVLEVYC